jgi:oxalate---CoA ligase
MSETVTIGSAILRHAEVRPDAVAVVATGFEPLSYRELRDYITHVSTHLQEAGLDRDARIAIAIPNGPQAALAILAIACAAAAGVA